MNAHVGLNLDMEIVIGHILHDFFDVTNKSYVLDEVVDNGRGTTLETYPERVLRSWLVQLVLTMKIVLSYMRNCSPILLSRMRIYLSYFSFI